MTGSEPDVFPPMMIEIVQAMTAIGRNTVAGKRSVAYTWHKTNLLRRGVRCYERYFQQLRRDGLLQSQRGVMGGTWLAKPPDRITVGDIARSVQVLHTSRNSIKLSPQLSLMRDRMIAEMDSVTLADLIGEPR